MQLSIKSHSQKFKQANVNARVQKDEGGESKEELRVWVPSWLYPKYI